MTLEIIAVLAIVVFAVIIFALEKYPVDLVALTVMALLMITGIITPEEGISGFSNSATVTVAAMFILSAGLFRTGALNFIGRYLASVSKKNYLAGIILMMSFTGIISAFINNTAVVALFLPIVLNIAKSTKLSSSKLLMPLSFSAILGGVCTLVGTSTNILASSIAELQGQPAFSMFEITPVGIVFLLVGILYMSTIGVKLLPDRKNSAELTEDFGMSDYITEIVLLPNAKSVNVEIINSQLIKDIDIDILEIQREDGKKLVPNPKTVLKNNDILKVRCNIEKLKLLQESEGIAIKSEKKFADVDLSLREARLVEAVVTPNSILIGKTLKGINFRNTFGATVLAIRHRGKIMREKLGNTVLVSGDVLLIEVKKDWLAQLKQNTSLLIISEVSLTKTRLSKTVIALITILGVVLTAAFNVMPIVVAAIIGSLILILSDCLSLEEAYKAIDWKVIFLLAGLVTLGIALEKSGGARLISEFIINNIGGLGEHALVSTFFFIAMILTAFMSNNASVVLLIPIAVLTAESLGVSARPFLFAITIAASIDFMTPIGYQTNTMIYGPGNYKFSDYLKIGTPLNILFWILGSLLIPYFFPL